MKECLASEEGTTHLLFKTFDLKMAQAIARIWHGLAYSNFAQQRECLAVLVDECGLQGRLQIGTSQSKRGTSVYLSNSEVF